MKIWKKKKCIIRQKVKLLIGNGSTNLINLSLCQRQCQCRYQKYRMSFDFSYFFNQIHHRMEFNWFPMNKWECHGIAYPIIKREIEWHVLKFTWDQGYVQTVSCDCGMCLHLQVIKVICVVSFECPQANLSSIPIQIRNCFFISPLFSVSFLSTNSNLQSCDKYAYGEKYFSCSFFWSASCCPRYYRSIFVNI